MKEENKLTENALGLSESITMGVAGTAPAYSIEITTSTIIATTGILSPATILVCGLIMFGIAFAFIHLNKMSSNAGTSYAWVSSIFGSTLGSWRAGLSWFSAASSWSRPWSRRPTPRC